jgi:hypothetical protein
LTSVRLGSAIKCPDALKHIGAWKQVESADAETTIAILSRRSRKSRTKRRPPGNAVSGFQDSPFSAEQAAHGMRLAPSTFKPD